MASLMGNAEVPSEAGKSMCACMSCKLVKTYNQVSCRSALMVHVVEQTLQKSSSRAQFVEGGCENCEWLNMAGDRDRVTDSTTVNFTGYATMITAMLQILKNWRAFA